MDEDTGFASSDAGRSIVIFVVPGSLASPPHPLDAVDRGEYEATTNRWRRNHIGVNP